MTAQMPSEATIRRELEAAGILRSEAHLVPLTGGVSCEVWRVPAAGLTDAVARANPHGLVVKAPLATLRTPSLWQADVSRGFAEGAALQVLGAITPASVPRVAWRHPEVPVLVVEAAPESWQEWREQMLDASAGTAEVDGSRLADICAHLGRTLAAWHAGTQDPQALPEVLRTGDRLRTLRTDPFHRATAQQVPQIADELLALAGELETARVCLVHGDYSPKNVLVSPPGAPLQAWMLDAEVAHVGDPALDVAYLSTHLACKAVARPHLARDLDRARRTFEQAYRSGSDLVIEARWSRHTGAILAARMRGVSRVTYLTDEQERFLLERACALVMGQEGLDDAWAAITTGEGPAGP